MSHADVFNTVSQVVPCAHVAWGIGNAPNLPWAVYRLSDPASFSADNDNYIKVNRWRVELYEKVRDAELENSLLAAIRERFGTVTLYEEWVPSEKCTEVIYEFSQIER